MTDDLDFDALDKMLAQPALIADRGFSERVSGKFRKTISSRSKLFALAVAGWLALSMTVMSPQVFFEEVNRLLRLFNFSEQFNFIRTQIGSLDYSSLQSIDYSAMQSSLISLIIFALAIAAVSSTFLRN